MPESVVMFVYSTPALVRNLTVVLTQLHFTSAMLIEGFWISSSGEGLK